MIFTMNPDEIVTAVYTILAADVTLQGSGYLNGATGKIWKNRSPDNRTGRWITIELGSLTPDEMSHYTGEIRIHAYTDILSNGQISPIGNTILSRCEVLLNNVQPTITGGSVQPLYSLGVVSSFLDVKEGSRAHGVLRLRCVCGKTG